MNKVRMVLVVGMVALLGSLAGCHTMAVTERKLPDVTKIQLQGTYPGHLQDVWFDGKEIWWAHTRQILRTDLTGHILRQADVEGHHAGCEVKDGKLYVAVCPMQSTTKGKTTKDCRLQINVYDAETLQLLEQHILSDVNDRAGSLAILEDGSFVIGCLRPQDILPSQVRFHHISADFKLIQSYVLDNVPVKLGIEVIKRRGRDLYFCCYQPGGLTIKLDENFRETARYSGDGTVGLIFTSDAVWTGFTHRDKKTKRYASGIHRVPSQNFGL